MKLILIHGKDKINFSEVTGKLFSEERRLGGGNVFENSSLVVFFNDLVGNDFNTFFTLLPPQRQYYAAISGKSLHFAYSSCALNWLSKVPEAVIDKASPAWNNGKIYHLELTKKLQRPIELNFARIWNLLNARSEELVEGGLMAIIMPSLPDVVHFSRELEKAVKIQGQYSIETLEVLSNPNKLTKASLESTPIMRGVFDGIIVTIWK
ncbi:hypothetical protein K2173_011485 [Erythroxylum novogranatense]|uniref:Uncharacterized protein n=1 Tax=Erythroxylum novogranatense TaxID=1862640 RepID=A0AAV8S665_9ROSI|nr:hypothetical protein K2173_011485 [Erythroxylum novogranatense]